MASFELLLILALLLIVIAIQLMTLRKVRRIDLKVWSMSKQLPQDIEELFRQAEALQSLYWDLKPEQSLPPTRGWAGSPDFLREVARHALDARPQTVVECSSGVSTLVLARCLQKNGSGHIYSLEHSPEYAAATRQMLARQGLSEWSTVIDAPLVETTTDLGRHPWYDLSSLPVREADLIVIDGPPMDTAPLARYPAGPKLVSLLSGRGKIFLDDANRPEEQAIVAKWLAANSELVVEFPHCEKGLAVLHKSAPRNRTPSL